MKHIQKINSASLSELLFLWHSYNVQAMKLELQENNLCGFFYMLADTARKQFHILNDYSTLQI
jgi:hypothetical protein